MCACACVKIKTNIKKIIEINRSKKVNNISIVIFFFSLFFFFFGDLFLCKIYIFFNFTLNTERIILISEGSCDTETGVMMLNIQQNK